MNRRRVIALFACSRIGYAQQQREMGASPAGVTLLRRPKAIPRPSDGLGCSRENSWSSVAPKGEHPN